MRRFGIEIEALGMTASQAAQLLSDNGIACSYEGYTHRVMRTWKVVTDATVGGGFEVVSPPMSGTAGIEEVKKVVTILNEAGCDVRRNCGIHVHIEVSDLSAEHIANIYNRYRKFETQIDAFMPASRRGTLGGNGYCRSLLTHPVLDPQETPEATCSGRPTRYLKVNLSSFAKYGTVEFRHHGGSLNTAKIANWINFLQQFVEASRPVNAPAGGSSQVERPRRGKSLSILEALEERGWRGVDPTDIGMDLDMTRTQAQRHMQALRAKGYTIECRRGKYYLSGETRTARPTADGLWNGIESRLQDYYARRAAFLAG